jgi:hypothetical protein
MERQNKAMEKRLDQIEGKIGLERVSRQVQAQAKKVGWQESLEEDKEEDKEEGKEEVEKVEREAGFVNPPQGWALLLLWAIHGR